MTNTSKQQKILRYEFSEQGSTDDDGFNDGVSTQFDQNIVRTVARESIQNILDARDLVLDKPALAKFDLIHLKTHDVPEYKQFIKILKACLKSSQKNTQSDRFFRSALQHLESDREIPVLRISDFNTVGLTGNDEDPNGNYRNFLKAAGSTNKIGNMGGSYGLGKGALIAASSFRTIFVSSCFGSGKTAGKLFQGKCRLISHKASGTKFRGIGSFGLSGEKPVRCTDLIPSGYVRSENGTDIYILGMRDVKHWKEDMVKEIVHHFWRAIQKGDLAVELAGQKIDKNNIESKIFEIFEPQEVYKKNEGNPIPYYQAYVKGTLIEKTLSSLGKVSCRILAKEGFPNQMYCLRATGMKIEERDFRSVVQYAGVFECENNKGNDLLRSLEPPNHDEWTLQNSNAKDPEGDTLPSAKKAYEEFINFCRECVKSLIQRTDRTALSIKDLEKYISLPSDEEEAMEAAFHEAHHDIRVSEHETGNEGPFLSADLPIVTPPRKLSVTNKKDLGDDDNGKAITLKEGDQPPPPKKGGDDGTHPGSDGAGTGSEGSGEQKIWLAVDAQHRAFAVTDNGDARHLIVIRGKANKDYFIRLLVGTDDNYAKIPIHSVLHMASNQSLPFKDNLIQDVKTDDSGTAKISVKFEDKQQYSLNIGIYES